MKFKDFKYCIVTDEHDRPMTFSELDGQLCYCNSEDWKDDIFPIKVVTIKTARKQIRISTTNRLNWGYAKPQYKIYPVIKKETKEHT